MILLIAFKPSCDIIEVGEQINPAVNVNALGTACNLISVQGVGGFANPRVEGVAGLERRGHDDLAVIPAFARTIRGVDLVSVNSLALAWRGRFDFRVRHLVAVIRAFIGWVYAGRGVGAGLPNKFL